MPRDAEAWLRAALLLIGLALGIYLRVQGLGAQALFGDEYHTVTLGTVELSYGTILGTFDNVGSTMCEPRIVKVW